MEHSFINPHSTQQSSFPDQRVLVPLSTLEDTLFRNLYPLDLEYAQLMTMALNSSPPNIEGSVSPRADSQVPDESNPNNIREQSDPDQTPPAKVNDDSAHPCLWVDCEQVMSDPETLYNHLCNDHIGRKSTGNLCLTCKWKDCGTTCAKRDHITSHLRGTSRYMSSLAL